MGYRREAMDRWGMGGRPWMGYGREAMDRWGMGGRPWIGGVWEGGHG